MSHIIIGGPRAGPPQHARVRVRAAPPDFGDKLGPKSTNFGRSPAAKHPGNEITRAKFCTQTCIKIVHRVRGGTRGTPTHRDTTQSHLLYYIFIIYSLSYILYHIYYYCIRERGTCGTPTYMDTTQSPRAGRARLPAAAAARQPPPSRT